MDEKAKLVLESYNDFCEILEDEEQKLNDLEMRRINLVADFRKLLVDFKEDSERLHNYIKETIYPKLFTNKEQLNLNLESNKSSLDEVLENFVNNEDELRNKIIKLGEELKPIIENSSILKSENVAAALAVEITNETTKSEEQEVIKKLASMATNNANFENFLNDCSEFQKELSKINKTTAQQNDIYTTNEITVEKYAEMTPNLNSQLSAMDTLKQADIMKTVESDDNDDDKNEQQKTVKPLNEIEPSNWHIAAKQTDEITAEQTAEPTAEVATEHIQADKKIIIQTDDRDAFEQICELPAQQIAKKYGEAFSELSKILTNQEATEQANEQMTVQLQSADYSDAYLNSAD